MISNQTSLEEYGHTSKKQIIEAQEILSKEDEMIDQMEIEKDDTSITTVGKSNKAPTLITRCDGRLKVEANENADVVLTQNLAQLQEKMQTIDRSLKILPWKNNNTSPHIINPQSIPTQWGEIRKYIPRAAPLPRGGTVYFRIQLESKVPIQEIVDDMSWWLRGRGHGIWVRPTQEEDPISLGWMLNSVRNMETEYWSSVFTELTGHQVGCQWKVIPTGAKGKNPESVKTRALHLECGREHKREVNNSLKIHYSSKGSDNPPDQMQMRIVPDIMMVRNSQTKSDIRRLRLRQEHFNNQIGKMIKLSIDSIDFKVGGKSLRERMMAIKSRTDPRFNLFHTVTPHWQGEGIMVYFLPHLRSEAENIADRLLTYLRHKEKENGYEETETTEMFDQYFSSEVREEADNAIWDESKGLVMQEDD